MSRLGLNRVMLLGYLESAPELRTTQNGVSVLNLRLATPETHVDADGVAVEQIDYHHVVVWGRRAETLARVLTRGSAVFVEGSLRTSSYDGPNGKRRERVEVVASNILLG